MTWTHQDQRRLDHLRAKELGGTLVGPEDEELAALMARVEAEEAAVLAPAMARLQAEAADVAPAMDRLRAQVADVEQQLSALQSRNEELAKRVAQQESLAADMRRFLAELD